ncbi:MAG: GNAT family N-acetyltransferase [Mesorhizobium sp.]
MTDPSPARVAPIDVKPIDVTVTFLEMSVPLAHYPPLPFNRNVVLLRAKDAPNHYYRYLIDRIGRKWNWVNALRQSDEEMSKKLAEPGRDVYVLHIDGVPGGMFEIAPHEEGTVELVYFGMMAHAMGHGIGRWFLGAALQHAWSRNPTAVRVQTCTLDHPAALPLYQKLGFDPVGQVSETVYPMTAQERAQSVMRE